MFDNLSKDINGIAGLSIGHLNVRSLLPKIDEIRYILHNVKFDVFCINESWLDNGISESEFNIDGYKTLYRHRNRHGGGIVVYIKENIIFTRRCDLEQTQVECLWIEVKFNNKQLLLCSIYRPPSAKPEYFDYMLDLIEKACCENKIIVIIGDININYCTDCRSSYPLTFMENLNDLTQLIHDYTRVTDKSRTIIDHIYTTNPESHKCTGVFHTTMSDHYLIHTVLENIKPHENKQLHNEVRYRCYKNFDEIKFTHDVCTSAVFNDISLCTDVNNAWSLFKNEFLKISNNHAPIRVSRLKHRYSPWINGDIIKLMYRRDHLHKVATRTGDIDIMNEYRSCRRMVNQLVKEAKCKYYDKLYSDNNVNSNILWKELSKLTGKNDSADNCCSPLSADELNDFFTNIGRKTVSHLFASDESYCKGPDSIYDFNFVTINSATISKLLMTLNPNSSLDILDFDSKLLRLCANNICEPLTIIFNLSITTGVVPSDWKYSRVTPVYKGKGETTDSSNFRPISVLGHIAKIIEKEIQCQLVKYLVNHDFITLDQSAYREFHSTSTCLHNTIDEWLQNMDDKLYTGICFLDISKCFDTIDHNILLMKLQKYGVRNIELKFFASYLSGRTQSVKHKNVLSDPLNVDIGVPQGSTLGPLLFTLFVNDLPMYVKNGRCSMFADDTIIYCNEKIIDNLNDSFNSTLQGVIDWYKANRLVLNVSKSCSMIISPTSTDNNAVKFNPIIDGNQIDQVNCTKYLGVYIDNKLNFDVHINELTKNLSRKLAWLSRLRKIVPIDILKLCYTTYVMPIFDYACSVWGCTPSNINTIQRLQNRAARIITGNFDIVNIRGIDLVRELKWQTIEERINYFLNVLMYNCVYGQAPNNLCNSIVMACEANERNTRINETLQVNVPYCRTNTFKKSFIYRGSISWNKLPNSYHDSHSVASFKSKLKGSINRTNTAA